MTLTDDIDMAAAASTGDGRMPNHRYSRPAIGPLWRLSPHPGRFRFAMLGSSARKLRRFGVNLLAGRAIRREFYPLTGQEMSYDFSLNELLAFGSLPAIRMDVRSAVDVLEAYTATYLREEIQQESLIRDLPSFSRFLEVAALANAQVTSVASMARDAGVARPTVQRYFDVLVDTLIGVWVPPWKPKARVKEVGHPKFYFFDTGVVRALRGATRDPVERAERGPLLETLILHELRAHMAIAGIGGEINYWGTPSVAPSLFPSSSKSTRDLAAGQSQRRRQRDRPSRTGSRCPGDMPSTRFLSAVRVDGKNVVLAWRAASDSAAASPGWWIDSVSVRVP